MLRSELPLGEAPRDGRPGNRRPARGKTLRSLAVLFGVLVALFTVAGTAGADETAYPPGPAVIGVSNATACPADQVTFYGRGYAIGGEPVTITSEIVAAGQGLRPPAFADVPGIPTTVAADADGNFSIVLTMVDGNLRLTATGTVSGLSQTVSITRCAPATTVTPTTDSTAPGGPLPETGAGFDITSAIVLGIGAVLIGLILAYIGTRDMYRTRRTRRIAH